MGRSFWEVVAPASPPCMDCNGASLALPLIARRRRELSAAAGACSSSKTVTCDGNTRLMFDRLLMLEQLGVIAAPTG